MMRHLMLSMLLSGEDFCCFIDVSFYCLVLVFLGLIVFVCEGKLFGLCDVVGWWYWFMSVDELAVKFDHYMKRYPELYEDLTDVVAQWVGNEGVVVDVGCGSGLVSVAILKRLPGISVVGVEPSEDMRKVALSNVSEANVVDRFSVVNGFSDELPFEDESVDGVVSRYSLPYWPDPAGSCGELFRVLRPGGVVIFEALNGKFSSLKLWLTGVHMVGKRSGLGVARYHVDAYKSAYSVDELKDFLSKAGFVVEFVDFKKGEWRFLVVGCKP